MKLLVVDDESDVQFLFQQKFRKEIKAGTMQIKYALNGISALELIESFENKSDYLMLTDINMPEMNGIELLKKVKSKYPELKVFMITAYSDEQNFTMAKKLGADDYFTKPLQFDLLKQKLNHTSAIWKNNEMQLAKILVVDDEPDLQELIKQKFRNKIKANEYEFHFAVNGVEALEKISNDGAIDLVLTDINMPVMDGLTLLTKINELNNKLLRSVIVSAYGDMENIRTAMNRGAYDFITKPIDLKDLEVTIEKSLKEIEEYKLILAAQTKLIALQQELDIANIIQTSILPKTFPPFPERKEFEIFAKMIPAKEVGGDLFDFFFIDKYRLGVVIGDVSGKGIAAAL